MMENADSLVQQFNLVSLIEKIAVSLIVPTLFVMASIGLEIASNFAKGTAQESNAKYRIWIRDTPSSN